MSAATVLEFPDLTNRLRRIRDRVGCDWTIPFQAEVLTTCDDALKEIAKLRKRVAILEAMREGAISGLDDLERRFFATVCDALALVDEVLENSRDYDELASEPVIQIARFNNVSCSQCGRSFGPGNHGFSQCTHHFGRSPCADDAPTALDGL